MYQLKPDVSIETFLKQVHLCKEEVFFKTADGDNLNLKSQLSHYVLMIIASNQDFLLKGIIACNDENDYEILKDYIVAV